MKELELFLDKKTLNDVINEVEKKCFDIPFGRSKFQIDNFVVAASLTPERAYRQILLEIQEKLNILRNNKFDYQKMENNRNRQLHKLKDDELDQFDRVDIQIELDQSEVGLTYSSKLIVDLIKEIEIFYTHLQKYPEYTREEFEQGELKYYEKSLTRQVQGDVGANLSLLHMTEDKPSLDFITNNNSQLIEGVKSDIQKY